MMERGLILPTFLASALAMAACLVFAVDPQGVDEVRVGDRLVHGESLKPFEAVWYVRMKNGENWRSNGTIRETLAPAEVDGKSVMQWTQVMEGGAMGFQVINETTFSRDRMQPLTARMNLKGEELPPQAIEKMDLRYGADSIEGTIQRPGADPAPYPGMKLDQAMFDGNNVGLILAALPLKKGFEKRFAVSFVRQNTSYWVVARVTGQRSFDDGRGGKVTAWSVDTDWIDRTTGDAMAGGPDKPGGTYYVVSNPPEWYPHVAKYISEGFDTEVIPSLLRQAGDSGPVTLPACAVPSTN